MVWTVRKQDTAGGNGVTGGIWLNGKKQVAVAIAANSSQGVTRTNYLSVKPTDVIDLVLTPVGPNGVRTDGNDNSVTTLRIETVPDTDSDGLPDPWENIYSPGDLAKLRAAGDADGDGLTDLAEMPLGTDPTKLHRRRRIGRRSRVNTGKFVSAITPEPIHQERQRCRQWEKWR